MRLTYTESLKKPIFNPTMQSQEFLGYAQNVLDKALLIPAIGVLESEMPLASGLGFPIKRVPKSTVRILKPYTVTGVASAQRAEKAEAHVAGIGAVDYLDRECITYAEKELITSKAVGQLGFPLLNNIVTILTRMVNLPIEKAVIDSMIAATCQTAAAGDEWDGAAPVITKDIETARRALVAKGFPRQTHRLIVSGYDYSSILLYLESKGFMGLTYETSLPFITKYFNLPVILEENAIGETDILEDKAIVFAQGEEWGCIVESVPLRTRTWKDENLDGTWVEVSRECKPVRVIGDSVYTITNTVT
jgi:hypothetical protein